MAKTIIGIAIFLLLWKIASEDRRTKSISNRNCTMLLLLGVFSAVVMPKIPLWERVEGALIVSVPMFLLTILIPGAFGGGDIKLMAAAGVLLGWPRTLLALCIAVFAGSIYVAVRMFKKRLKRKDTVAFGPFLCVGIAVAFLWGEKIIEWYLKII